MSFDANKTKNMTPGGEGSSLAIALFFFLICSLMCAGVLYLASSSSRGVSKSISVADKNLTDQSFPALTSTPPPLEGYEEECEAINIVYEQLYYDFYYSLTTIEKDGSVTYKKTVAPDPENLSYEIINYINNYYGKTGKRGEEVKPDENGILTMDYTVTVSGKPPVKVEISLIGAQSSSKNNLVFESIVVTISTGVEGSECSYKPVIEYSVPAGKQYHIRYSNFTFVVKNK